jgi:hypothetical protein
MPQVDIASFFDIAAATLCIYVAGFAFLNLNGWAIPAFLETVKVGTKRLGHAYAVSCVKRRQLTQLHFFPLISL